MTSTAPVSVVIPCYRCAKTVERAVISVASQTQLPAEVILVDDGSGDGTRAVLQALAGQYSAGWIRLVLNDQNRGAASARNCGWEQATQPYVAFLDSDDAWHPEKIAVQVTYMQDNPTVLLCGHEHRLLHENLTPDWQVGPWTARQITKWPLLLSNQFVTPSVIVRTDVRHRFVQNQRYMEDHMLWLDIVCSGGLAVKLSAALAAVYKQPFGVRGLSSRLWLMERGELGNYLCLYRKKYLGLHQLVALCAYSVLKFGRRLVMYGGYLRWRK